MSTFPSEDSAFRYLGEELIHQGFFFKLTTGTFAGPNGEHFEREIVRHPGAVCVVAIENTPAELLLVRQYRGSVDRTILEVPAGKLDVPGESLAVAAERELAEEVGRRAETMTEIGSFLNSPGFTDERTTCFLAEGLTTIAREAHGIEEEYMTIVSVPLDRFWSMVDRQEIVDAKTIIAVTYAERVLKARPAR